MAEAAVKCPHCQSEAVVKYGKTSNGKERFRCQQRAECGRTFVRSYAYPGCLPTVKQQIVEMTLMGVGSAILPASCMSGPIPCCAN
jgi:transposase-like protein